MRISDLSVPNTSSGEHYRFEDVHLPAEAIERMTAHMLLDRLRATVAAAQGPFSTTDYDGVRNRYIALNRALTHLGLVAPRFRPTLHAGARKHGRTDEDNLISNDHQVLDLEWLCLQCGLDGRYAEALPIRWQPMFGNELNLPVASKFVGIAGSAENKAVEILRLGDAEQMQLRAIQSESVRNWWRSARAKRARLQLAIRSAASANRKLQDCIDTWPDQHLATECAKGSGVSAPAWCELITGEEVAGSTLSFVHRRCEELLRQ